MQPDEDLHFAFTLHVKFQYLTAISLLYTEPSHLQIHTLPLSHSHVDGRFTFNTLYASYYERMFETDLAVKSFPGKLLMKFRVSTAYLAE